MKKSDFYFDLPEELIAQTPLERRDASRLLTLDKATGAVEHHHFYELPQFLRPNDCLILNDSRVLPARLLGHRSTGGAVEVLLLRDLGDGKWECLTRPGRKTQPGTVLSFGDGELTATVVDAIADGNKIVQFHYEGIFLEVLERLGKMPLPPYIKAELQDQERYQTVYSRELGSAAAPTAGLHFTKELLQQIADMGVRLGYVTLHVGLGTFRPVKEDEIEDHPMHSEFCIIPEETARIVNETKASGGRVICVGTTSCRTVESFAATARGLGADAVGINCSLGPKEIFPMAKRLTEALPGSFPVFVKPNAGLPRADGSGYDITPQLYAMQMKPYRELGLFAAGGCCGTTPEFIQLLNGVFADCRPGRPDHPMKSVVCSPMDCVDVDGITVVGERINPTGKKRFQQALREGDMNYVLEQAVSQTEAGAQILDVNVGAPGVDEPALMEQVVKALQSVVSLPLQLDSSHAEALERGLRVYNGKPIVNSVNGEAEKLNTILPLCKKYGAAVVGLAIDERGILPKAEDRVAIARRIRDAALAAGIPQEDIYIDCLTLTASAQQEDVLATVQALHACKEELGVRTILGVSNISFGLPCRSYLNTTFLTMAMYAGLDLAIMNPSSEEMMAAVYAYNVLTNRDRQSTKYIERYANRVPASAALVQAVQNAQTAPAAGETPEAAGPYAPLMKAVEKGLKGEAAARTRALLEEKEPLELVDEALIPALDIVGAKYEKGTLFLPQLLQAATAAQGAFEEIKTAIAKKGEGSASKGRIVIATVKGDVHDIGKNIVRVILENYGFEVIDLGRDVPVETVVNTVREKDVHLVGLSALMTTTLKSMEETIRALHDAKLDCKIMVGGAVLTPEYAKKIGADWYAKDAKQSADIAKEFFGV